MAGDLRIGILGDYPDSKQARRNPWNLQYQVAQAAKAERANLVVFASNEPHGPLADLTDSSRLWRPILMGSQIPPRSLFDQIEREDLDLLVFNLGATMTSFVPRLARASSRLMGLLTAPIYRLSDLAKAGLWDLVTDPSGSQVHFLSPLLLNRRSVSRLKGINLTTVTLSDRNKKRLVELGHREEAVRTLLPPLATRYVVPNGGKSGPNDSDEPIRDPESYTFLFMGSPTELRGAGMVVRAFASIAKTNPGAKLLFLSRPDSPGLRRRVQSLTRLAIRLGCSAGIQIVDRYLSAEEVRACILRSDALLLPFRLVPSDLPVSLLEAMALGKPVIATDVDGIPELIKDGRGIVIPPSDLPALVTAMARLIENPPYGEELGANAREYLQARYANVGGQPAVQQLLRECLDT